MINELIKLATHLDKKGLRKEADYLDAVIKKIADDAGAGRAMTVMEELNQDLLSKVEKGEAPSFMVSEDDFFSLANDLSTDKENYLNSFQKKWPGRNLIEDVNRSLPLLAGDGETAERTRLILRMLQ